MEGLDNDTTSNKRRIDQVQNAETAPNSRPRSGSAVSSDNVPSASTSALKDYLKIGASIDLLTLPNLTNDGYPALAVDAASGTGKTQQAFAFLAQGFQIVYMLCTTSAIGGGQLIYSAMNREVGAMSILLSRFKLCSKTFKECDTDMSIESLKNSINSLIACSSDAELHALEPDVKAVESLARNLYRCLIKKSQDNTTVEMVSQDYQTVSFENIVGTLKDKILFVDEAIPAARLQNEGTREELLRLLRNIARALQMRAVMAGTASCLPNMMRTSDFSRRSAVQTKWMECSLYWQPVKTDALPTFLLQQRAEWQGLDLTSVLKKHRPLFLLLLDDLEREEPRKELGALLKQAGTTLEDRKCISLSNKFHWLSGAWLEGGRKVPSAFNTMAPDLVRGHFFEPGITVVSESTKPYLGTGISSVDRVTGPRTLHVDRYTIRDTPWWSISNFAQADGTTTVAQTKKNTSLTRSHDEILGSLTTCVQQCLVREPLLAVAMSFAHGLSPSDFKKSVSKGVSTSLAQHTVGCVSGEINEHICFAALQLASLRSVSDDIFTSVGVRQFLTSLFDYLDVQSDEASLLTAADARRMLPSFFQDVEGTQQFGPGKSLVTLLENINWKGATVPLLIPASSKESLEAVVMQDPTLFGGLPIAGLVPGITNARLDANAYEWKKADDGGTFDSCWNFEFKVFSNGYTTAKAHLDLHGKCKGTKCHALLIAFRPDGESQLDVRWDGVYLRIVALFRTAP